MKPPQSIGNDCDQILGGRYKLIHPLGKGGFGHTFLAADLHLPNHPRCVIKQLKPHAKDAKRLKMARRLFDTEARVLYRLGEHPRIPRLLAHFEDRQEFYLAQELIEGPPLSNLVKSGQRWPESEVLQLLLGILTPLTFVHEQGVIHRDLKPSNLIRRAADGHVVLIDFGAVKQVRDLRNNAHGQATQTVSIGTQGYTPNEQLAGQPCFSSDIYAVGIIALQALTGTAPHLLKRNARTSEILWQTPELKVSEAFGAILSCMARYDARDRYPTAAAALAALQVLPNATPGTVAASSMKRQAGSTHVVASAAPATAGLEGATSIQTAAAATYVRAGSTHVVAPVAPTTAGLEKAIATLKAAAQQSVSKTVAATVPIQLKPIWRSLVQQPSRRSVVGLGVITLLMLGTARSWLSPPQPVPQSLEATSSTLNAPSPASVPRTAENLVAEANELRELKQYENAITAYRQALAVDVNVAGAQSGLCDSFNRLHQYAQAMAACESALAINPNNTHALWSMGYALEQQGQLEIAFDLYDQAVQVDPDYSEAWNNRGVVLHKLERPREALNSLDQAVQLNPDLAQAWNNRGAVLWRLRQFDEALASVNTALKLQPGYQDAQSLRKQMLAKLGH